MPRRRLVPRPKVGPRPKHSLPSLARRNHHEGSRCKGCIRAAPSERRIGAASSCLTVPVSLQKIYTDGYRWTARVCMTLHAFNVNKNEKCQLDLKLVFYTAFIRLRVPSLGEVGAPTPRWVRAGSQGRALGAGRVRRGVAPRWTKP